nr:SpoIIE family protein phosphatase [Motilibacter deserti]
MRLDGTVVAANATLLAWVGRTREEVVGRARLAELLTVGGRIYWETHLAPLLIVERRLDEVAVELRAAGSRLPVLLSASATAARRDGPAAAEDADGALVQVALTPSSERSRYERELLAARRVAEQSAAHVRALQEVTAALSRAVGVEAVAGALLSAVLATLRAPAGTVWVAEAGATLVQRASAGEAGGAAPAPSAQELAAAGEPCLDGARVVVPLHGRDALRGVLSLVRPKGPTAPALDRDVLVAVGRQAGLALDRAQLYEQQAGVAHELQRALLVGEPPEDPRYEVAAAYQPGVEALEVGGDWSDVFLARTGVLAVVVGDVVGRGLGAAGAMGQLRSAVRALAGTGAPPARLLTLLDGFVAQIPAASMATLAYAELDLATGLLSYACAGHPPPLLLPPQAPGLLLWEGRSTPLGAFVGRAPRTQARAWIKPGARLLFYTDGLVERRRQPLDDGLLRLREAADRVRDVPGADAVGTIIGTLLADAEARDDVCMLLLTWLGPTLAEELPADLRRLPGLRRSLGEWLAAQGVPTPVCGDVVLAASEAVANAVEHGCAGGPGLVRVSAGIERHADRPQVVVTVSDDGRWREAGAAVPERGRGLRIMRGLMDDVQVMAGEGTTVVLRRALGGAVP